MTTTKDLSRRQVREKVLQALYAYVITNDEPKYIKETLLIFSSSLNNDKEFAHTLFDVVINNEDKLSKYIKGLSENWGVDRIAMIDKILLKMGMCEMLFFEEIPTKVTLNEIIELAKTFSTDKSPKFINGILNAFLQKETKSGIIVKQGRGLK